MNWENEEPIIVGGFSGTGTRVPVYLLMAMGVYMGPRDIFEYIHEHMDSLIMAYWLMAWRRGFLTNMTMNMKRVRKAFDVCLVDHLKYRKDEKLWGWKNPPNQDCIEYYHKIFPKMKYIHVVRDGRDISPGWMNGFATGEYSWYIPEERWKGDYTIAENYMWMWNKMTNRVLDYCVNNLEEQSLVLRLEDMVYATKRVAKGLAEFIGADDDIDWFSCPSIIDPGTIGRYKKLEPHIVKGMTIEASEALDRLGYEV